MEGSQEKSEASKKSGRFKTVCVFCGSRSGYKPAFSDAALELGKELVILQRAAPTKENRRETETQMKNTFTLIICFLFLLFD